MEETFLGYLNEWKASVISRTDLSKDAQSKMLLSRETQEGLYITGIHVHITCVRHEAKNIFYSKVIY